MHLRTIIARLDDQPGPALALDRDEKILTLNQRAAKLLGHDITSLPGTPFSSLVMGQWGNDAITILKQAHDMGVRKKRRSFLTELSMSLLQGFLPKPLRGSCAKCFGTMT